MSSCEWPKCNTNWIPNLTQYYERVWIWRNGILKTGTGTWGDISLNEAGDTEPLNSAGSPLLVSRSWPSTLIWGKLCFAWRSCNGLPWGSCLARHSHISSGPIPALPLESRPTTRLKSQQAPKGEVQTVTPRRCTATQNSMIFLIYIDRNLGNVRDLIVKIWDNMDKTKLDEIKFTDETTSQRF